MSDNYFIDTNIFVYSFDHRNPNKQAIAQEIIQNALIDGKTNISYQVVQEVLNKEIVDLIKKSPNNP